MRHNYFFVALLSLAAISCSISEIDNPEVGNNGFRMPESIYAVIDDGPGNTDTKVYADNQLRVLWNHDDRITYWNNYTYGYEYAFQGSDGANAGNFSRVGNGPDGPVTGNDLGGMIYSIYPHRSDTEIDNDGNISFILPAEQAYKERSFGRGANTMVSRTETSELRFKNVGGYLSFNLYGQGVYVTSITLKGNNHEKLAGKCTIGFSGGLPAVTMNAQQATEEITLTCNPPVALGNSSSDYTEFWMVVPPVEFSRGITFTVTTLDGGTYEKSSTSAFSIVRNVKKSVPAMKVTAVLSGDIDFEDDTVEDICVAYWDTDQSGSLSYAEAAAVTSLFVDEALTRSGENLVSAFAGTGIETFDELIYFTGLTEIEAGAFAGCTGLGSVVIPETVTTIGENAFNGCTGLESIVLSSEVPPALGTGAFDNIGDFSIIVPEDAVEAYTESTGWSDYFERIAGAVFPSDFPDPVFRAYVFENFDTDHNDVLSEEECNAVTSISVNTDNIVSMEGLRFFQNLSQLYCSGSYKDNKPNGQLAALDISNNPVLTNLACHNNRLLSLDVSQNTMLEVLNVDYNQLTSLDVSNNTALKHLNCTDNQLSDLVFGSITALKVLLCYGNQLTSLDVSHLASLLQFYCENNRLASLDVSGNPALEYFHCYNNLLSSLNVSDNTALKQLSCDGNQLTSLNVNSNTALFSLYCSGNALGSLDVSHNTALTSLDCGGNRLSSLDVSHNTALTTLYCAENQLTSLDVSQNTALTSLDCGGNQLPSLDVSLNTALTSLKCGNNQLSALDVTHNSALFTLYCQDNLLTDLDVSQNTAMFVLVCNNSTMTTLYLAEGQTIQVISKDPNTEIVYKHTITLQPFESGFESAIDGANIPLAAFIASHSGSFTTMEIDLANAERDNVNPNDPARRYLMSTNVPTSHLYLGTVNGDDEFIPGEDTVFDISDFANLSGKYLNYRNDQALMAEFNLFIPVIFNFDGGSIQDELKVHFVLPPSGS